MTVYCNNKPDVLEDVRPADETGANACRAVNKRRIMGRRMDAPSKDSLTESGPETETGWPLREERPPGGLIS